MITWCVKWTQLGRGNCLSSYTLVIHLWAHYHLLVTHKWYTCNKLVTHLWPSCHALPTNLWPTCGFIVTGDQFVTHLWTYCYSFTTVYARNSFENCVKFSLRLNEIFLRIVWNSLKIWMKFSEILREILVKIAWCSLKVEWYFVKSYVKIGWNLREILSKLREIFLIKTEWNFRKNWARFS